MNAAKMYRSTVRTRTESIFNSPESMQFLLTLDILLSSIRDLRVNSVETRFTVMSHFNDSEALN